MFEIDKEKFGAFVAQLRKEKGLMQKQLAERLYVSDKAVSKWERGLSLPDVAILVPLAEILGVTVTELLECRRLPADEPLGSRQTEEILRKVIGLSEEEQRRYRPDRGKRGLQLLLCALVGALEVGLLAGLGYSFEALSLSLFTVMLLMAVFGLYFCVFAKEKLPRYYDENRISVLSDGFLRMNLPGVSFNNHNWPHIVRAGQLWAMIGLVATPAVYFLLTWFLPDAWDMAAVYILLALTLGGLFIPMTIAAKKNECAPENRRTMSGSGKSWIWILAWIPAAVILALVVKSGFVSTQSGLQMGWVESNTRDRWSASYALHEGYVSRTINTDGEPTVLYIEIVSDSGAIGMTITNENGNVIYVEEEIGTSSFALEIPGKVTVKITGEKHRGSYCLSW